MTSSLSGKNSPVIHQHPTQDDESDLCSDGGLLPVSEKNNVEKAAKPDCKSTVIFLSVECKKFVGEREQIDFYFL